MEENQTPKPKTKWPLTYLIVAIPVLFAADFYAVSWIADLLSQPNDTAVIVGVLSASVFIFAQLYLIKLFNTKF